MPPFDRLLLGVGLAHGAVGLVCLGLLRVEATAILGVHPALKPLKFAVSIAVFLVTLAVLLPAVSTSPGTRRVLAGALALSMIVEMTIIGGQALRGRRSHFNFAHPLDAALTATMLVGIFVLLLAMIAIALLATARPLALPPLMAGAFRAALWLFLFSAVSGLGMGGRGRHTVGGDDGGPGMALTNWSSVHGDLRVSHFLALHALQILPLFAAAISRLPLGAVAQWALLTLGILANLALTVGTWLQALASRPVW